jgi:hypothetical protein
MLRFTTSVKSPSTVRIANDFAQFAQLSQPADSPLRTLPARAHQLLWFVLMQFDARSDDVDVLYITVDEIRTFIEDMAVGNNRKPLGKWGSYKEDIEQYSRHLDSLNALLDIGMEIDDDAPKRKYARWRTPVRLFDVFKPRINAKGKVEYKIKINENFKGHLYNLSTKYTSFQPRRHARLKHKHALRLYPALKSRVASTQAYQMEYEYEATLSELRHLLAIPSDAYPKDSKFYTHVIAKAVDDINENSDLFVAIKKVKSGRHLKSLVFYIQLSKANQNQLALSFHEKVGAKYEMLKEQSLLKLHEIDLDKFRAFYSKEFRLIRSEVTASFEKRAKEAKEAGEPINPEALATWIEGHIVSRVREFICTELATYGVGENKKALPVTKKP